jgi:putative ABC transport system ATP-binding protein
MTDDPPGATPTVTPTTTPTTTPPGAPIGAELHATELVKAFRLGDGEPLVAVNKVSLDIAPGAVVALTGPSGSGKSTLLHLLASIEGADAGTLLVDGFDVTTASGRALTRYRRGIGLVFQRFHLLPVLDALDNVVAPVLPYRTDFDKKARAKELLAAVGLEGRERSLPSKLSGGQQQRVAIARALIARPKLLLADEPTGNLDSGTGEAIIDLLLGLRAEFGMTMVIATHDERIAERCERRVHLVDGTVVDDPEEM